MEAWQSYYNERKKNHLKALIISLEYLTSKSTVLSSTVFLLKCSFFYFKRDQNALLIYIAMAPVRCKHVEVTEVALRIASFQTPQQSVASRPCCTNREWYTLYVAKFVFVIIVQGLHKIRRFPLGWVKNNRFDIQISVKIFDWLKIRCTDRITITYILSFAANLVNFDRFFLLNVNKKKNSL